MFQSTPDLVNRENGSGLVYPRFCHRFNPLPIQLIGRIKCTQPQLVQIHGFNPLPIQLIGRISDCSRFPVRQSCFNPLPIQLIGRILTRPPSANASAPFQSTPDLVNRENGGFELIHQVDNLFQSTPDLVNRENGIFARVFPAPCHCFNPLPIQLIGRIGKRADYFGIDVVSIHSRFS